MAIEEADPDGRNIVAVLDGIPGAYEHAMQNLERARACETIPLDELQTLAEVRLSTAAVQDLDRMILTHSLPPDTRETPQALTARAGAVSRIGRQLEGRWRPLRFILGPWRWMLIIYSYEEPDDVVLIVAFQDGRSSAAATVS